MLAPPFYTQNYPNEDLAFNQLEQSDHVWLLKRYGLESAKFSLDVKNILSLYHEGSPNIKCSSKGKPFIQHSEIHFSLSHTGDQLFLIVSKNPVGIDAEITKPRKFYKKIAAEYFPEQKIEDLRDFYKHWTAREAFLKILDLRLFEIKRIKTLTNDSRFFIGLDENVQHRVQFFEFSNTMLAICQSNSSLKKITFIKTNPEYLSKSIMAHQVSPDQDRSWPQ